MKRRIHYENITNPAPRISRLERRIKNFKKLFTMKNLHKTIITIIIIGLLGVIYSMIAAIWGFKIIEVINVNGKIFGTFIILFIINLFLGAIIFEWDDVEDMFDFEQYSED